MFSSEKVAFRCVWLPTWVFRLRFLLLVVLVRLEGENGLLSNTGDSK